MPKSMQERLAEMGGAWGAAKANYDQRFGGVKIDEGEYVGKLQRCELGIRRSDDAIVVNVEYLIRGGKFDGYVAFDQMNLSNEWGRVFAIRFVEVAGYEFPEADKVATVLQKTCAAIAKDAGTFKILVVHNGDFVNVQPKALVDSDVPADEPVKNVAQTASAKSVPAPASPASDNLAGMDRKALKTHIRDKELDIRVTSKMSDDDIRSEIRKLTGTSTPPVPEVPERPTDDELASQLLALCKSQGIKEVKKGMSLDDMIDKVEEYEFVKTEIDEDEVELLTMLQLEKTIKA